MLKRRKQKSKSKTSPAYHAAVIILLGLLITSGYALIGPVDFSQQKHAPPKGRAINNIIELQIALARQGFSPGPIDGTHGRQTKQALGAFQLSRGL